MQVPVRVEERGVGCPLISRLFLELFVYSWCHMFLKHDSVINFPVIRSFLGDCTLQAPTLVNGTVAI